MAIIITEYDRRYVCSIGLNTYCDIYKHATHVANILLTYVALAEVARFTYVSH